MKSHDSWINNQDWMKNHLKVSIKEGPLPIIADLQDPEEFKVATGESQMIITLTNWREFFQYKMQMTSEMHL